MHACVLVIVFSLCNIVSLIFRLLKQNVWVIIACSEPRHDVSWCVNYISGQIIIFHQSRFPWNKAICWGFPYYPTIWGEVVWGRYYLPRYKDMFFFEETYTASTNQPINPSTIINHHQLLTKPSTYTPSNLQLAPQKSRGLKMIFPFKSNQR